MQGKRESVCAVTEMNKGFLRFEWNTGNGTTQWRTKRISWKKGKGRWGVDHAPVCSLHPELCIEGEEEGNPFKTGLTEKAPNPPFSTGRSHLSPGCWSLGLTWAFRRSKLLRFHSILSLRFRYFAKLCNYVIRHHTPLIVFSMEMAPCHRGYLVCGCLRCNVVVA